ncbi:four-helix bundle copper-binding protein [Comamonas thiooxydans]|uniref:four-helix bundle copper-binding protein n=1 Tax=Comamonas thiooxydans TaxID=363952 RepID=UPI003CFDD6D0
MISTNPYLPCIDECDACAVACDSCFAACLKESDVQMMTRCIMLDTDCAAICRLAASSMARNSEMAKQICRLCAEICLACANECERHTHQHCQACALACRKCAAACVAMIQ